MFLENKNKTLSKSAIVVNQINKYIRFSGPDAARRTRTPLIRFNMSGNIGIHDFVGKIKICNCTFVLFFRLNVYTFLEVQFLGAIQMGYWSTVADVCKRRN